VGPDRGTHERRCAERLGCEPDLFTNPHRLPLPLIAGNVIFVTLDRRLSAIGWWKCEAVRGFLYGQARFTLDCKYA
jgi:hypothetical protein